MCDITKIHNGCDKIGISTLYVHKASLIIDHSSKHEHITTNIQNLCNNGHKCYIFTQSQAIFFMHQVPIVIVVDSSTKINQLFPEISQQTQNLRKLLP